MQKKLICGLALAAIAGGTFVACGDGDVSGASAEDKGNIFVYDENYYKDQIASAVELCSADPECAAKANGTVIEESSSSAGSVTEPSSGSTPNSSGSTPITSSGSINLSSSSTGSSSTSINTSSSSTVTDPTVGSCAPSPATISKGGSTTWTFTPPKGTSIEDATKWSKYTYEWTLTGSTDGTSTGVGAKTATATYLTHGEYGASVSVDGQSYQCSALQVNGDPITGCKCAPTGGKSSVDVSEGTASWTVSCTSEITSFTWTGATGTTATATTPVTKKGEKLTPTVTVANSESKLDVACEAVTVVDATAPDYVLDGTTEGAYTVQAGTYTMQYACNASQYHQPPLVVTVSGATGTTGSWSTASGKGDIEVASYGQFLIEYSDLFGTWAEGGDKSVSITLAGEATVKCQ